MIYDKIKGIDVYKRQVGKRQIWFRTMHGQ